MSSVQFQQIQMAEREEYKQRQENTEYLRAACDPVWVQVLDSMERRWKWSWVYHRGA